MGAKKALAEEPASKSGRAGRVSGSNQNKLPLLIGLLVIMGGVYVLLPKKWFEVEDPARIRSAPPAAKSIETLRNEAKLNATDSAARIRYGNALGRENRFKEAEAEYKAASRLAPDDPALWYNLGILYLNSERHELAEKAFNRQLEYAPGDPQAHYYLGIVQEAQGRLRDAEGQFTVASKLAPDYPEPKLWLAILHARRRSPQELEAELKPLIEKISQPDLAYYMLARSYMRHQQYDQAAEYANKAIGMRPNDFAYWHTLGQIYQRAHKRDDALKTLLRALEIYDKSAIAHAEVGLLYRAMGKPSDAIAHFEKAIAADPQEERIHNYLASAYRSVGDTAKAQEHQRIYRKLNLTGQHRRRQRQRQAPL